MEIEVDDSISLNKPVAEDIPLLSQYLSDKEIYNNTLRVPYPYTEEDASNWLRHVEKFEKKHGVQKNWIIRNEEEGLLGVIGLHFFDGVGSHKNEIGYWLAKRFWNKGIMTKVVAKFTAYCFEDLDYRRIEAPVFTFNHASESVLLKNDFEFEGLLKGFYLKEGQLIDAKMYAKTS